MTFATRTGRCFLFAGGIGLLGALGFIFRTIWTFLLHKSRAMPCALCLGLFSDYRVIFLMGEEVFKTYTRGMKYRTAVDYGLFADFDKVLDLMYEEDCKCRKVK